MLSRSIAILLASWLPAAALILPMGTPHTIDDLIAGAIAVLLSALAMSYDRARLAAALVGVWVAMTAFVFTSTLLEEVVAVCWGTMMFTSLMGPLSRPPQSTRSVALNPAQNPKRETMAECQAARAA